MRYGSLFSGIGGFDLGLDRAGWECAWQVEIDEQCRQVLRRHWPDVPKHEDVTDVGESDLARVDLICGGFPCQDLSVAGRREGLAGERSGLFFEFMRVVGEIAPRWVLIENVPGLRSSWSGDTPSALGIEPGPGRELVLEERSDMDVVTRRLGELGYGWTYSSLDTQYWGPPQRRERVFIVGHLGAPCPPEVLLEPESLPWNPPPSREAGKGPTPRAARSLDTTCGDYSRSDADAFVVNALQARGPHRLGAMEVDGNHIVAGQCHGTNVGEMGALRRGNGNVTGGVPFVADTLISGGREMQPHGTGDGKHLVAYRASEYRTGAFTEDDKAAALTEGTDQSRNGIVLPFDTTQITSKGNYSRAKPGDPCHPLAKGAHPPAMAFALRGRDGGATAEMGDDAAFALRSSQGGGDKPHVLAAIPRRLTPRECERLQGFPDDWTRWGIDEGGERVEMADTPRYRMLGNAVSVPVAHWIGHRILEATTLPTDSENVA